MRNILLVIGGIITIFGVLFALQGSGAVHGSPMTGSHFWLYAGIVIAIVGVVLLSLGLRTARRRT